MEGEIRVTKGIEGGVVKVWIDWLLGRRDIRRGAEVWGVAGVSPSGVHKAWFKQPGFVSGPRVADYSEALTEELGKFKLISHQTG